MLVYQRVSHFLPHRSARLRWALPGGPRASEVVWRGPSRTKTPMRFVIQNPYVAEVYPISIYITHVCVYIYIYMYTYMLIPNKKELGHIFNQYSISGYISSESTFWIPRTTPASRSREVKLVAMQLPLADLTGSQIWRNGKFVLEKRTLTAKKDRRVGHQHFTRILLDLFGVCYPCIYIYIYICMYIYIYHKA